MSELPAIYGLIWLQYSQDDLAVIAINNTSSVQWLQVYAGQRGITYPFIYDTSSSLFNTYQVNTPPTYIIIDREGIVQYRIDDQFNKYFEMKDKIEELL